MPPLARRAHLTKPQAVGLTAALAVVLVVFLPAGLFIFWRARLHRQEAEADRLRLTQLAALGLPLPDPVRETKACISAKQSVSSSVRPSWRMYVCRGRDLGEREIMGRSKTRPMPGEGEEVPAGPLVEGGMDQGKGKGKARQSLAA